MSDARLMLSSLEGLLSPCCLSECVGERVMAASIWMPDGTFAKTDQWVRCLHCGMYPTQLIEPEFCNDGHCRSVILKAPRLFMNDPAVILASNEPVFTNDALKREEQVRRYGWIVLPVQLDLLCLVCRALQAGDARHKRYLVCIPSRPGFFGVAVERL
jgi:hypothetical protein